MPLPQEELLIPVVVINLDIIAHCAAVGCADDRRVPPALLIDEGGSDGTEV